MVKRAVCLALCVMILLMAGGCWNYRSLGDLSLVLGMAIDFDDQTQEYILTYEVFQVSPSSKSEERRSTLVDGRGKTIFDAVRNVKRRVLDKLYFGSASVVIVSEQFMRSGEILTLLGWFLSDAETRETLCLAVAQTDTAREILKKREDQNEIISILIHDIISEDAEVTASASYVKLYEAFNMLYAAGLSLTLPAVHMAMNEGELTPELNGSAVFRHERLVGYLSAAESKFFLLARGKVHGGILSIPQPGEKNYLALEISSNSGGISVTFEGEKPTLEVECEVKVYLGEKKQKQSRITEGEIKQIETEAAQMVRTNIEALIKRTQKEFRSDIFGFGNTVYKHDLSMWQKVGDRWQDLFETANVKVEAKVHVRNTAFMK